MAKLNSFFIGYNEGKNEALYKNDFERYYFDYNSLPESLNSPEKYIILGRKGSGKTILAEFYKKINSSYNHICEIISYKEFKFHELLTLKSEDISPNEYILIWEWIIYIHLAKHLINDESITDNENKKMLRDFFDKNYQSAKIDSKKILEITKSNKLSISMVNSNFEHHKEKKECSHQYIYYYEHLQSVVMNLIGNTTVKYSLFFDELDDRFRDEEVYKDSLVSLIKAANKINTQIFQNSNSSKIFLLIRSDIFYILNDPDLNKIRNDNSVLIDWGNRANAESPLIEMILEKIRKSIKEYSAYDSHKLYKHLFPQSINYVEPSRFILERTFFRPRDIITYLNLIIKKYPSTDYFGYKGFLDVLPDYSEYFYQEVRNELIGHLSESDIDKGTLLLKQFNKYEFNYKDIKQHYNNNKTIYGELDLENLLRVFFKFSIVGHKWLNENNRKTYYSWSYRDSKAEIDYNKVFIVHLGLRIELSM